MIWTSSAGDQEAVDAMVRASADRPRLAALRVSGRVGRRDAEYEERHPDVARPFVADVEARVAALRPPAPKINLAIRPKKRRR